MVLPSHICVSQTQSNDISSVRAVCKRLNIIVAPKFFSRLTVDINKDNLDSAKHLLTVLSAGESPYSSFTETIGIRSLAPAFDPKARDVQKEQVIKRQGDDDPDFGPALLHMKLHLGRAITSLKKVSSVSYVHS
jgi:hypothetical protein